MSGKGVLGIVAGRLIGAFTCIEMGTLSGHGAEGADTIDIESAFIAARWSGRAGTAKTPSVRRFGVSVAMKVNGSMGNGVSNL